MNNKMKPITQSCLLFIWLHALNVVRAEESGDVRLVGGTSHCNGVLEMKHQREWRPVHRGPFWTGASSAVVCRQLQCGTASSTEIQRVDSRQSTWNIRDQCVGSESSLRECGILVDFTSSYIIKVICAESVRLVNNLRLVHSEHVGSLCSGRVEVKSEQSWLSVCEGDFDQQDAEVVCRELGCGPPSVLQGALYGEVKAPMWTKEFQCDGSESALLDCRTADSTRNTSLPDKTVGLTCSESNDVRLVAGTSHCNGKLEMKYLGEWREVDDWSWNQKSSAVACRQLGCGSVEAAERFRAPSSEIRWWIESSCDGSESSLWECVERERHNNSYIISTYSGHQVGLTCSDLFKPNITNLPAARAAGV